MKHFLQMSPRHQKWGLFLLLAGTLGFNLSMNPDHFNNISRNEVGALHTMDLAATAAAGSDANKDKEAKDKKEEAAKKAKEAETAAQSESTDTAENKATKEEKAKKSETKAAASTKAASTSSDDSSEELPPPMIVRGKNGVIYKATVFKAADITFAKLVPTEAGNCVECLEKETKVDKIKASLDKNRDLLTEIQAIADGRTDEKKSSPSKSKEKGKLDAADLDRAALSEIAKTCKSKDRNDRLDCHTDNLVKLSQKLDDSPEAQKAIRLYFDLYMQTALNENFKAPTTDWMSLKVDVSRLSSAEDISLRLLRELNEENSSYVIQRLTKLKAGSYSAQASTARDMYMLAQNEKRSTNDMFTMARGYMRERMAINALTPQTLNGWLMTDTNAWNEALVDGNKDDMRGLVQQNLYSPVQGMIGQLSAVNLYAPNTVNGQTQQGPAVQLAQIAIPDLSDMAGAMVPGPTGSSSSTLPALPGSPSSPTASALANRFNAPVRGAGLVQFPMTWLTTNPQPTQPSPMLNPTSAPVNLGAPSTIPGQGAVLQQPGLPQTIATSGVPGTPTNINPGATSVRGR